MTYQTAYCLLLFTLVYIYYFISPQENLIFSVAQFLMSVTYKQAKHLLVFIKEADCWLLLKTQHNCDL